MVKSLIDIKSLIDVNSVYYISDALSKNYCRLSRISDLLIFVVPLQPIFNYFLLSLSHLEHNSNQPQTGVQVAVEVLSCYTLEYKKLSVNYYL